MADVVPLTMPAPDAGTDVWSAWLTSRTTHQLDLARGLIEALKSGRPESTAEVLDRWNEINLALDNAEAACELFQAVHPDPVIREQAEEAGVEASRLRTDLSLDREIFDLMVHDGADEPETSALGEDAERVRILALRDFRRAGVDRDPAVRDRIGVIHERLTELGQMFQRNIRDEDRAVTLHSEQLEGLPADWIERHAAGSDGLITVGMELPEVLPMLRFASDRDARVAVETAFHNRAWPANDEILVELLALRRELATMLGYDGWPSYDAEVKMIRTGDAIGAFIDQISKAAEASALRDRVTLLARVCQDRPDVEVLDAADSEFYIERLRREHYDVDAQEVRRYFSVDGVRRGVLDVTGRLFGLTYTEVDVPTWHADVMTYDVSLGSRELGRIYLDLHPRPNKFHYGASFVLVNGVAGHQLPEGVLVCNFPRGLMEHAEVVVLFHEFGHLLHQVLGGHQSWIRFAGMATEWDFVEAPSQLLEEWAWDAEVLAEFARDEEGHPIPPELVARMRAAHDFAKGLLARWEVYKTALSYRLHQEPPVDGDAITKLSRNLQAEYSMIAPLETHFHASFLHLDWYSSGYYTYDWSLVIAKDLFSSFDPDNLFEPQTAASYRDRVLAQGARKDAADLVEDFLGRPFGFESFANWLSS